MKRFLVLVAAVLLVASPAAAQSVPHPSPTPSSTPTRYEAFLAAIAPANLAFFDADDAVLVAIDAADAAAGRVVAAQNKVQYDLRMLDYDALTVDIAAAKTALDGVVAAAELVSAALEEMAGSATAGLAVLDYWPPDACFRDLWAVERAGFLLALDTFGAIEAGDVSEVGMRINAARYLLGPYGDLIESVTVCP